MLCGPMCKLEGFLDKAGQNLFFQVSSDFFQFWIYFYISYYIITLNLSFPFLQLQELQDKYAECMEMLHEAQEELKNLRNKTLPLSTPRRFHSLGLFPMVSSLPLTSLSVTEHLPDHGC